MRKLIDKFKRSRLKKLLEKEREVQFTRQSQLTMAGMGHGLILAGVTLILWLGFAHWPPIHPSVPPLANGSSLFYFYVMEGVIVAFGFISIISARQLVGVINEWVDMGWSETWMNAHPKLKDRSQNGILILLFALQFGSMAALVVATSGPIESPFAPMALAIGIFTPFIVNRWGTIALIILTTMAFYVVMIVVVGTGGDESHPEPGAYAAVNLFILLLASIMTFKRRDSLSFTVKEIVKATPEQVWRAWTEADEVATWLRSDGAREPEIFLDVSEGGGWWVKLDGGEGQLGPPWSGRYLEVEAPKRLVFTVDARSGMGEEIITVELKPRGERTTEMVVTQADHGRRDGLEKGWSAFMARMHGYLLSHAASRSRDDSDSR